MSFLTNRSIVYSLLGSQGIKSLVLIAVGILVVGWLILPRLLAFLILPEATDAPEYDQRIALLRTINLINFYFLHALFFAIVLRRTYSSADLEVTQLKEQAVQFFVSFLLFATFVWLLRQYFVDALIAPLGIDAILGLDYYTLVTSTAFTRISAITLLIAFSSMLFLDMARPPANGLYGRFVDALRDGPTVSVRFLALMIIPLTLSSSWRHFAPTSFFYSFRDLNIFADRSYLEVLTYWSYFTTPIILILNAIWLLFVVGIAEILLRQVPEIQARIANDKIG